MKTNENKKGISLIVLIITILVMIILAAAIILNIDDTKLIGRAEKAVSDNQLSIAKEIRVVARAEWRANEEKLSKEYGSFSNYLIYKLEEAEVEIGTEAGQMSVDEEGSLFFYAVPPIPEGYVASSVSTEDQISEGLVIYQGDDPVTEENVATAKTTRNQFVWVPVPNISKFERKDWYTGNVLVSELNSCLPTEIEEYNVMKASVEKYGGFYIGRYEASKPDSYVLCVAGKTPYTQTASFSVAKNACKSFSSESVVGHLVYGEEWDAALTFIATNHPQYPSSTFNPSTYKYYGRYSSTVTTTASKEDYRVNNIYDMAGNAFEWTMEEADDGALRGLRGGYASTNGGVNAAGYRSRNDATRATAVYGFRPALYVK